MNMYERFKEYFASHREEIINDLSRAIAIPSVLSAPEADAPNGAETMKMLKCAVEMFREYGINAKISEDKLYALANYGEGEKKIGIFSHGDVVPVDDKWIMTSPFDAKMVDGCLFGRGTLDNKNALVFALWLLRALRELGIETKSAIEVFVGSNEEAGMNDIEAYAENEKMPDLCIVPDNDYPVSLGEKGRTAMYCRANNKLCDVIDVFGGDAENIVLGEVTAKIKYSDARYSELCEKADGRYKIEKNGDVITVMAKGLAAHAAHPEKGENATGVLCDLLLKCKELCANDKEIFASAQKLLAGYNAESFNSCCEDTSFGKSTCANGIVSVCDGALTLSFDIRYGINMTVYGLCKNAEQVLSSIGWHIVSFDGSGSFEIPRDDKLACAILDSYRKITGDEGADFYYSGGGTYAKHLENAFSIGMSQNRGIAVRDLPAGHGSEHQPDEFLYIDGYINAMAINATMIMNCDEIL